MCSAAEDAVTAATSAEHLQRLHSANSAAAVLCPLLIARLSQDSVGTPITSEVPDSLTDLIVIIIILSHLRVLLHLTAVPCHKHT